MKRSTHSLSWRLKLFSLLLGMFCFILSSCIAFLPRNEIPSATSAIEPPNESKDLKAVVKWSYQDKDRFGVEISIEDYPVPLGFHTSCPLTQLEVESAGKSLLLYKHPDQIDLDEFYAISAHNRWNCVLEKEDDGFADYLFSLTHFYKDTTLPDGADNFVDEVLPDLVEGFTLVADFGEVNAVTGSQAVITLPSKGIYKLPLRITPSTDNLTWFNFSSVTTNGISVQINRVALNPSAAWVNACLTYQDHHNWIPKAELENQGHTVYSVDFLPTYPPFPSDVYQSDQRCYSFSISINKPIDITVPFQVGISQVIIDNTNPGIVTAQECEFVKDTIEKSNSEIEIICWEYETHGEKQIWFQMVKHPSNMTAEEAYIYVEDYFRQTIYGPWLVQIP